MPPVPLDEEAVAQLPKSLEPNFLKIVAKKHPRLLEVKVTTDLSDPSGDLTGNYVED